MIPACAGYFAVFVHIHTRREHHYPVAVWSADGEPVVVGRRGLVTITTPRRYPDGGWIFARIEYTRRPVPQP
ncbi:hypothetical protein ACWDOR_23810 [Streptosporangium canum]